ncbi:hypothetical protein BJV74DRAFT_276772 [Russula compacta]|nr:hypothetical protein BJV74DRAFT_276772 [Russula compacta]
MGRIRLDFCFAHHSRKARFATGYQFSFSSFEPIVTCARTRLIGTVTAELPLEECLFFLPGCFSFALKTETNVSSLWSKASQPLQSSQGSFPSHFISRILVKETPNNCELVHLSYIVSPSGTLSIDVCTVLSLTEQPQRSRALLALPHWDIARMEILLLLNVKRSRTTGLNPRTDHTRITETGRNWPASLGNNPCIPSRLSRFTNYSPSFAVEQTSLRSCPGELDKSLYPANTCPSSSRNDPRFRSPGDRPNGPAPAAGG